MQSAHQRVPPRTTWIHPGSTFGLPDLWIASGSCRPHAFRAELSLAPRAFGCTEPPSELTVRQLRGCTTHYNTTQQNAELSSGVKPMVSENISVQLDLFLKGVAAMTLWNSGSPYVGKLGRVVTFRKWFAAGYTQHTPCTVRV